MSAMLYCDKVRVLEAEDRELAYTELKLDYNPHTNTTHVIRKALIRFSAHSCHGNQGVPWDSLVDCPFVSQLWSDFFSKAGKQNQNWKIGF